MMQPPPYTEPAAPVGQVQPIPMLAPPPTAQSTPIPMVAMAQAPQ